MKRNYFDRQGATDILRRNDLGGYTIPTHGLYPFQWSWDSAITALGWLQLDEVRAWQEVETMFTGQWANGMVPHILFHGDTESYFPGPDVWGTTQKIPSSAISQPPIWATAVRLLFENTKDRALANEKLAGLLPNLLEYHRWWYRERDPKNTGLVCSYHPWESGMDNSPAWDVPLANVPLIDWSYERRDLNEVDSDQRPKKDEYDRYLYLVDFFKECEFDSDRLYENCPYKVLDIGIISVLHRASMDLLSLCAFSSSNDNISDLETNLIETEKAISSLWWPEKGCFASYDLLADARLDEVTSATVLPLFANLANAEQVGAMGDLLRDWIDKTGVSLSSTHPESESYERQRYWRGPVWLHINWMIAEGLVANNLPEIAEDLKESSRRCVQDAGFWEYFDSENGAGCGGEDFSWTAAIGLHWLDNSNDIS